MGTLRARGAREYSIPRLFCYSTCRLAGGLLKNADPVLTGSDTKRDRIAAFIHLGFA